MTLAGIVFAPSAAPLVSILGGVLLLPAGDATIAAPLAAVLGVAVLALTLLPADPSLAFLAGDGLSSGFSVAIALLGAGVAIASADAPAPSAGPRRAVLARAAPAVLTGFALLAVRLADPYAATGALFASAATAVLLASTGRGPGPARAAFGLLQLAIPAFALLLAGLLLRAVGGAAIGAGAARAGAPLASLAPLGTMLLAAGLLAFAGVVPFGAANREAAAHLPVAQAPLLLLTVPFAAFAFLLRTRAALGASALGADADAAFLALGALGLLLAGAGRVFAPPGPNKRIVPLRRDDAAGAGAISPADPHAAPGATAAFFLSLALFASGLGGAAGVEATLLALASAALAVPLAAFAGTRSGRPSSTAVALAVAALPPFGGFAALLLALDRAAVPLGWPAPAAASVRVALRRAGAPRDDLPLVGGGRPAWRRDARPGGDPPHPPPRARHRAADRDRQRTRLRRRAAGRTVSALFPLGPVERIRAGRRVDLLALGVALPTGIGDALVSGAGRLAGP